MSKRKPVNAQENAEDFSPRILEVMEQPPTPLHGTMLRLLALFLFGLIAWAAIGELDIVARAEGKLIPQTRLKVVQPFEGGRIEKILVQEGQSVKKDQPLLVMDTHLSHSDTEKLKSELANVRLQLRRIDAELEINKLVQQEGDEPEQFTEFMDQLKSHQQAYKSALAEQNAFLDQTKRELETESVRLKKLEQILPIQKETEATYQKLGKEGYASKQSILEKKQNRIEIEKDLAAQKVVLQSLKARMRGAQEKIRSIESNYKQQLFDEKQSVRQKLAQLEQDYKQQTYRNTLMELKAPQDGMIMELATHTEGTVIPSGSVVMRLVPHNEPLKAEVYVSNQDVGFIKPGQTVRLKLATYQFQKYGMIDAVVESVSADAIDNNQSSQPTQNSQSPTMTYRTLLVLNKQQLERDGQQFSLRAGMHVIAEIMLGKRTVLEYLLSPIQKTLSEAGTER